MNMLLNMDLIPGILWFPRLTMGLIQGFLVPQKVPWVSPGMSCQRLRCRRRRRQLRRWHGIPWFSLGGTIQ